MADARGDKSLSQENGGKSSACYPTVLGGQVTRDGWSAEPADGLLKEVSGPGLHGAQRYCQAVF